VVVSASDLVAHLACGYLTQLERAVVAGKAKRPFREDPGLAVLVERGREHEARYLAAPTREGRAVTEIAFDRTGQAPALARAVAEKRRLCAEVTPSSIKRRSWAIGCGDTPIEEPSDLGAWSYEPHDTQACPDGEGCAIVSNPRAPNA
jgi:hypothetical protein